MPSADDRQGTLRAGHASREVTARRTSPWAALRFLRRALQDLVRTATRTLASFLVPLPEDAVPEPDADATPLPSANASTPIVLAPEADLLLRAIADQATTLWRIETKFAACDPGDLPAPLQQLGRYLEAAKDGMAAAGLKVWDPSGEPYVPGLAVHTLAFQPEDGVTREVIHETIRPGLLYGNVVVRRPEVIIAKPPEPGGEEAAPPTAPSPAPAE